MGDICEVLIICLFLGVNNKIVVQGSDPRITEGSQEQYLLPLVTLDPVICCEIQIIYQLKHVVSNISPSQDMHNIHNSLDIQK